MVVDGLATMGVEALGFAGGPLWAKVAAVNVVAANNVAAVAAIKRFMNGTCD